MELRNLYWIFMCKSCNYPLIGADLVVNDMGDTSCHHCGATVSDVHYWNPRKEGAYYGIQSLYRFPDDKKVYTCCTNCGNAPFDETDDVTVDNYGDYKCHCGGELEIFEYDEGNDDYTSWGI